MIGAVVPEMKIEQSLKMKEGVGVLGLFASKDRVGGFLVTPLLVLDDEIVLMRN